MLFAFHDLRRHQINMCSISSEAIGFLLDSIIVSFTLSSAFPGFHASNGFSFNTVISTGKMSARRFPPFLSVPRLRFQPANLELVGENLRKYYFLSFDRFGFRSEGAANHDPSAYSLTTTTPSSSRQNGIFSKKLQIVL
jgi:hypothetical protein